MEGQTFVSALNAFLYWSFFMGHSETFLSVILFLKPHTKKLK